MAEISKQALLVANNTDFPNNNAGAITPAILRSFNTDMIDSTVNQTQYTTNSGSWNVSIGALNAFTASQQPTFNALNAFTASQLTINSGYNAATQSLSASIASVVGEVDTLQAWTGSVNQISDNGIVQGTSTRLHFYGLVSASIVPNVGGAIASINIEQDSTKVDTGSFNALTQSVNGILDYTASLKTAITVNGTSASIAGDLNVVGTINARQINTLIESSSVIYSSGSNVFGDSALDTQTLNGQVTIPAGGQLTIATGNLTVTSGDIIVGGNVDGVKISSFYSNVNATTQSINNSIAALSLSTGSSNAYTASNNQKWNDLQPISGTLLQTASFSNNTIAFTKLNGGANNLYGVASTGSNVFTANQTVNGNLITNGNTLALGFAPNIYCAANENLSGSQYPGNTVVVSTTETPTDIYGGYSINNSEGSTRVSLVVNSYTPQYSGVATPVIIAAGNNPDGSDTAIGFPANGEMDVWKVANFKYDVVVTGSVNGNIVPLTISSNTASMDLSQGNFFSLTLASNAATRLTATNIKPGQTINLLLTQPATTGSLTFSPSFKFSGGAAVSASAVSNAKDIITFVTFDTTSVYTAIIKNLS